MCAFVFSSELSFLVYTPANAKDRMRMLKIIFLLGLLSLGSGKDGGSWNPIVDAENGRAESAGPVDSGFLMPSDGQVDASWGTPKQHTTCEGRDSMTLAVSDTTVSCESLYWPLGMLLHNIMYGGREWRDVRTYIALGFAVVVSLLIGVIDTIGAIREVNRNQQSYLESLAPRA